MFINSSVYTSALQVVVPPKPRTLVCDFDWLCKSLKANVPVSLNDMNGHTYWGYIRSLQMESGSGKTWNVTLLSALKCNENKEFTFCVRTN